MPVFHLFLNTILPPLRHLLIVPCFSHSTFNLHYTTKYYSHTLITPNTKETTDFFVAGSRVRGDGGTLQWCPEEAGLAVAPDLPRAQHCLEGRPAACLLRPLLPPTLPGTRSPYSRLDDLHKRGSTLVFLPLSPIAAERAAGAVPLSAGWPHHGAQCRVWRTRRQRSATSPGCQLLQSLQRDKGVSRARDSDSTGPFVPFSLTRDRDYRSQGRSTLLLHPRFLVSSFTIRAESFSLAEIDVSID